LRDERVLRELLSKTDVDHYPRETGNDLGGLGPPDRADRAVGTLMDLGTRHGKR
jgi:hypothetical protein